MLDLKVIDGITESLKAMPAAIRKDLLEENHINDFPFTCEVNLYGKGLDLPHDILITLKFERK